MNFKQPYEVLITEKLQAFPVPDMADAIWARIEAQLDTDMPTDDPDGGSPAPAGPSPFGKLVLGFGITAVVIAFLSIFINSEKDPENNIIIPPSNTPSIISDPQSPAPSEVPRRSPQQSTVVSAPKDSNQTVNDFIDSIVSRPAVQLPGPVPDSSSARLPTIITPPPVLPPVVKDSIKKPRGVQGISDDDYRIEPKKKDTR